MKMEEGRKNIGIVSFPVSRAGIIPLSNLIDILHTFPGTLHVVTGNASKFLVSTHEGVHVHLVNHKTGQNVFSRILNYALTQAKISCRMARLVRKLDLWFFFIGGESLILPALIARLSGKKVILAITGSATTTDLATGDSFGKMINTAFRKFVRACSIRIVVYSERLVGEFDLEKNRNKIQVAHEHFLDFDTFKIEKVLAERDNLIGYIGRLSQEKGVLNFVQAIPKVLEASENTRFVMIGQGPLRSEVNKLLKQHHLADKVNLSDWIPHDEIPKHINQLRLLVLPSHTEGLPNIILEAIACGTPILVTSVGSIPDLIKDEETGFILEDNTPESIARGILRALRHPKLDKVAANARQLVEQNYTFEAAIAGYRKVFDSLEAR